MIRMKDICVSFRSERQEKIFGVSRTQVLFDISLSVPKGSCLGILGESGSGKSMTVKAILGLLDRQFRIEGQAWFEGKDLCRAGRRRAICLFAYKNRADRTLRARRHQPYTGARAPERAAFHVCGF